ncbi:MAG: PIN domain-containing protein [Deltaproteobacteria bacterium]|nr:PIN domain-containing protein [Deltaproteobacteria bacterium]
MSYLVDSCIIIDHLRDCPHATAFLRGATAPAISEITWIEVMVGAPDIESEAPLRALLSGFRILPVDHDVAEEAVRLRRSRRLRLPDALILATARVHRRTLATRNTRDFSPDDPGVAVPYRLAATSPRSA